MTSDQAATLLDADPDFRVLRRVPPIGAWPTNKARGEIRRAVFVDTETTGLDQDHDEVIELALLPFDYDRTTGEIIAVDEAGAYSGLREPSFPIPPETTRVHGITDADVAGRTIDDAAVAAVLSDVQLVIAHNSEFDRPMVEKHWPIFADKHWACSLKDIDWKAEDLGSGKLDYLLMRQGWFFDGHRALGDAAAGVFLLTLPMPASKRPALLALLECARRPLRAVRAEETDFVQRAALKQRGYRWDAGGLNRPKAWWILTEDADAEIAWLNAEIYATPRNVPVINMPATRRYSTRLWPE